MKTPIYAESRLEIRFVPGTIAEARQAARDGASMAEVREILRAGLILATNEAGESVDDWRPIVPLLNHPLAGGL